MLEMLIEFLIFAAVCVHLSGPTSAIFGAADVLGGN